MTSKGLMTAGLGDIVVGERPGDVTPLQKDYIIDKDSWDLKLDQLREAFDEVRWQYMNNLDNSGWLLDQMSKDEPVGGPMTPNKCLILSNVLNAKSFCYTQRNILYAKVHVSDNAYQCSECGGKVAWLLARHLDGWYVWVNYSLGESSCESYCKLLVSRELKKVWDGMDNDERFPIVEKQRKLRKPCYKCKHAAADKSSSSK